MRLKIFGLETKVGQDLFHRNALASLRKPSSALAQAAPVFFGYRLVIGSVYRRIEERLKEPFDGRKLRGRWRSISSWTC